MVAGRPVLDRLSSVLSKFEAILKFICDTTVSKYVFTSKIELSYILFLQASSKRGSLETKDDIPFRKVLGNPSRGSIKTVAGSGMAVSRTIPSLSLTSTPLRSGLLENR